MTTTSVSVGEVRSHWRRFHSVAAAVALSLYTAPPDSPWTAATPVPQATIDVVTRFWGHHVSLWVACFLSSNALQVPSALDGVPPPRRRATPAVAFTEEFLVDVMAGLCLGAGHLFCRCVGCRSFQLVFPPLAKRSSGTPRVLSVAAKFVEDRRAAAERQQPVGATRPQVRTVDPRRVSAWAMDACRSVWLLYRHSPCRDTIETHNVAIPLNLCEDDDDASDDDVHSSMFDFAGNGDGTPLRWSVRAEFSGARTNTQQSAVGDAEAPSPNLADVVARSPTNAVTGFYSGCYA